MAYSPRSTATQKSSYVLGDVILVILLLLITILDQGGAAFAQGPPPITPSGLNTQISAPISLPNGGNQYNITAGTRVSANLFHSFGQFGVPTNNIANFLNDSGLATSNILGRVTGGSVSNIFGTIQTTGFGAANLFLINPAGFLFGPTATVNVGGMVSFTTADYLRLADGARFNAVPNLSADALLSAAPVAAFGFLGSNPGAITVQGSQLSVQPAQGISLVGGNITVQQGTLDNGTVQAARLSAPGGQINLAAVASPGEVLYPSMQLASNVNGQSFSNMGTVTLSEGSTLDVSADAAGTIKIRGGQLVITDATLSADTSNTNGATPAIDINITGDLSITDTRGVAAITARTTGTGDAGEVRISSANLSATSSVKLEFALIDTHTTSSGNAGDVTITTTNNLNVTNDPIFGQMYFIDSGTIGPGGGSGGNVTMTAGTIQLQSGSINTGDAIARINSQTAAGNGGNVTITSDTFQMMHSQIATSDFGGAAGAITISASEVQISDFSLLEQIGLQGSGKFVINASKLIMDTAQIDSETATGPGGGITITASIVELRNGSTIQSQTSGNGSAGDIRITATDHLTLSDDPTTQGAKGRPTGLFTNSLGDPDLGNLGNAGAIIINTPQLVITGGARIDTTTQTNGHGGDVTITATNSVSISGERPTPVIETELFGLGSSRPSGIFTRTTGSDLCTGACGDAGRISITTGSFSLANGAQISSGTTSTGQGGQIVINVTGPISISGTLTDGTPGGIFSETVGTTPGSGSGGTIDLHAGQVTISNGAAVSASSMGPGSAGAINIATGTFQLDNASVSTTGSQSPGGDITITAGQFVTLNNNASITASSTGPGNAGNIVVNSGQNFTSTNSSVTTSATDPAASGGNITVNAADMVRLTNSQINASVQGAETTIGGNIVIDPLFFIAQNSTINASATAGHGGNITVTTNVFLSDANSLLTASSQRGINGTVTVQSPISQMGRGLLTLPNNALVAAALLGQRCAALASGQLSSFVATGRYTMPSEPGGWLTSPLAFEQAEAAPVQTGALMVADALLTDSELISLRRLPIMGGAIPIVSTDWMGCGS